MNMRFLVSFLLAFITLQANSAGYCKDATGPSTKSGALTEPPMPTMPPPLDSLRPASYATNKAPATPADPNNSDSKVYRKDVPKQRLHVLDKSLNIIKELDTNINCTVYLHRIGATDYFRVSDLGHSEAFYKIDGNYTFSLLKNRNQLPINIAAQVVETNVILSYAKPDVNNFYDSKEHVLKGVDGNTRPVSVLHMSKDGKMFCATQNASQTENTLLLYVDLSDGKIIAQAELHGPWDKADVMNLSPHEARQLYFWKDKILVLSTTRLGLFFHPDCK